MSQRRHMNSGGGVTALQSVNTPRFKSCDRRLTLPDGREGIRHLPSSGGSPQHAADMIQTRLTPEAAQVSFQGGKTSVI